jgi:GGDEF domain-containing protein
MSIIQKLFGHNHETGSLQGEMHRLEVVEALLEDTIKAYQSLIEAIGKHVPKAAREIGQEHKRKLKQIRHQLDWEPTKPLIGEVKQELDKTLMAFTRDLDHQLGQQEKETRHVMAIVAVMAESMADREKSYNVRFRGIGKKLRVLTSLNDISEIRKKLDAEVVQLEKYVEEMARDTESAVSRVQADLRQAKKPDPPPAKAVEEEAVVVKATLADKPLGTRKEAEQAIESRRRFDLRFCAARFSVDNIGEVAKQFGLPAAAGLMEQMGNQIRPKFEEIDLVCRWSDRDIVVITDHALPEVAERVAVLEEILPGPYSGGGREVKLNVRTCVIERLRGERGPETISRIDAMIVPGR